MNTSADTASTTGLVQQPDATLAYELQGPLGGPVVVMTHSILSSRMMWQAQAALLAARGLRVLRIDTRGHGQSLSSVDDCGMDDLGADTLAVMDALGITQAHYVGLSLGGMSGLGLGSQHGRRWLSLVICDARADAPPAVAAPWDERIALARAQGSCAGLAEATVQRWFGQRFVDAHPEVAQRFAAQAAATQVDGFVACARAIQSLDYLDVVDLINVPTTLVVGRNDGVLPAAMQDLAQRIEGSTLVTIDDAGHLPNIDQPAAFDRALLHHFDQVLP